MDSSKSCVLSPKSSEVEGPEVQGPPIWLGELPDSGLPGFRRHWIMDQGPWTVPHPLGPCVNGANQSGCDTSALRIPSSV